MWVEALLPGEGGRETEGQAGREMKFPFNEGAVLSMKSGKRVWVYLLSFQICKTYLNAIGNVAGERGTVTNVPFQRG